MSLFDKRASGRHFGFSRADLSSPTLVEDPLSPPTTASNLEPEVLKRVLLCPYPGPHGSCQRLSSPGSRVVSPAGRSDWPFPSVCGGHGCVLVPPIALPPGRSQWGPAGAPGAHQQPCSGQSRESAMQQRDGHEDRDAGGCLRDGHEDRDAGRTPEGWTSRQKCWRDN